MGTEATQTTDIESQLRELGEQMDAGEIDGSEVSIGVTSAESQPGTVEPTPTSPTAKEGQPEAEAKQDDEPESAATGAEKKEEGQELSEYGIAREADRKRVAKAFQDVNARKAELEQREQALVQREQALQQQASGKPEAEAGPAIRDEKGYSADDYEAAAKDLEEIGETEAAEQARELATKMRQAGQQQQVQAKQQAWTQGIREAIAQDGDFGKAGSELHKAAMEVLKDQPFLQEHGFKHVAAAAKARVEAAQVPALKEQVGKLTKEIERLTQLTSIGGSTPAKQSAPATIESMNLQDGEAALRRLAAELDGE